MMIPNELRLNALRKVPPEIAEKYGSLETARLIKGVREKYAIQNDSFVDLVGDIMLGLVAQADFVKLLTTQMNLPLEKGAQIENELLGLFPNKQPKGTTVPEADKETREKLELRPDGTTRPDARPLTREDVLNAIAPKRTMASDIASLKKEEPLQPEEKKPE